jgi:acetylornithine/succinyldiaminopimelate/putrescine aminotransferase
MNNRQIFLRNMAQTSDSPIGLEIEKAEGIYLYDKAGKKYIDLISGISVSSLGHNNEFIKDAIKKQLDKHLHLMVYGEYVQNSQVELAKLLTDNLPEKLDSAYFVNSGSEAVEGAMKLAKRFTGRPEVISFKNAYHGSSHGALSIMGNEYYKDSFRPLLPDVRFLKFNDLADLNNITKKTACVIIEPVQGEAGVIVPDNQYISTLRKKCMETGALLIFDEIQTGMGRTGKLFAFEHFNVIPDILLLAKAFGGGMPLGTFISSYEIMKSLSSDPVLGHITTFGGNPVCCAAGHAAMKFLIDSEIIETVKHKEELFLINIDKSNNIKEIRSKGLLIAIELLNAEMVQKTIKICLAEGLITDWFLFNDCSLRVAPPLIISDEEIVASCKIINKALKAMSK